MPDLFLSYAHVDKHWVDTFAALLEQRVNQYMGRAKPDRIWKDNRFSGNVAERRNRLRGKLLQRK
jgi:hypothetical protein